MRKSNFNVIFKNNNHYILLNTYSKKVVKISKEKKNMLIQNTFINDNVFFKKLIKYGFVVEMDSENDNEFKINCNKLVNTKTLHITMMMNYQCNFSCVYCFQNHLAGSFMNEDIIDKTKIFIEKEIIDKHIDKLYVEWFGGEPLIYKDELIKLHKEFLKISKVHKIPYYSRITTNGYELDLVTFKELYKNHCFIYYISLDGIKKTHDLQRPYKGGGETYEKIMFNLTQIHEKITNKMFRIEIRINNSAQTLHNIQEFILEFNTRFGNDTRFVLVLDSVQDWGEKANKLKNNLLEKNELEGLAKYAMKLGVNLSNFSLKSIETQICQAAKSNAYSIFYNGDIIKCQMALEDSKYKNINVIGNVTEGIDHNKEKLWVSNILEKNCQKCIALPLCYGKKCVYSTNIKKEKCTEIKRKFVEQIKLENLLTDNIEEI